MEIYGLDVNVVEVVVGVWDDNGRIWGVWVRARQVGGTGELGVNV